MEVNVASGAELLLIEASCQSAVAMGSHCDAKAMEETALLHPLVARSAELHHWGDTKGREMTERNWKASPLRLFFLSPGDLFLFFWHLSPPLLRTVSRKGFDSPFFRLLSCKLILCEPPFWRCSPVTGRRDF